MAFALTTGSAQVARSDGGEAIVAIETGLAGFDAVKNGVLAPHGATVMTAIQEPLLRYNRKTGEFKPLLALSWTASADQKTWTFKLRDGVKHHDGSRFEAADVAHHYNRILDPKNRARSRTFISAIDKVVVVDPLTVAFHLKHPWQALLPFL